MNILPFAPNRVLRLYLGGSGIDRLCGKFPGEDGRFPENWIASCIEGNGRTYHSPGHGISKILIDGAELSFPEYLKEHAMEMLGEKHVKKYGLTPSVLVKLLDSSEQLPLQVHPSKEDAKKYLHSDYGKTEAWIVLSTREINGEKPYLLAGFSADLDRDIFVRETLDGKLVKGVGMLNKIYVSSGDVIVIRGGLPHAIGPGVTMVEVMEPSDWVILPETACCGMNLTNQQRFMGIDPKIAVGMFNFTTMSPEEILSKYSPNPQIIDQRKGGSFRALIPPEECELFSAYELTLDGSWSFDNLNSFGIGVMVEGELSFDGIMIPSGGNFFLPYAMKKVEIRGKGRLILIRPPVA
jgi:mannose-6-phosphate isomerase